MLLAHILRGLQVPEWGCLSMEPSAEPVTKGLGISRVAGKTTPPQTSRTQTEGQVFPQGWDFVFSVSVSSSEENPLQILFLAARGNETTHGAACGARRTPGLA